MDDALRCLCPAWHKRKRPSTSLHDHAACYYYHTSQTQHQPAWPCCMLLQHKPDPAPTCMTMLHVITTQARPSTNLHDHAACYYNTSQTQHQPAWPCCMLLQHKPDPAPAYMTILHVIITTQARPSTSLHDHTACYYYNTSQTQHQPTWPYCMLLLQHKPDPAPAYMTILHVIITTQARPSTSLHDHTACYYYNTSQTQHQPTWPYCMLLLQHKPDPAPAYMTILHVIITTQARPSTSLHDHAACYYNTSPNFIGAVSSWSFSLPISVLPTLRQ